MLSANCISGFVITKPHVKAQNQVINHVSSAKHKTVEILPWFQFN